MILMLERKYVLLVKKYGVIQVKGAKDDLGVYEMYKDYEEEVRRIAKHRILAINRGRKRRLLKS